MALFETRQLLDAILCAALAVHAQSAVMSRNRRLCEFRSRRSIARDSVIFVTEALRVHEISTRYFSYSILYVSRIRSLFPFATLVFMVSMAAARAARFEQIVVRHRPMPMMTMMMRPLLMLVIVFVVIATYDINGQRINIRIHRHIIKVVHLAALAELIVRHRLRDEHAIVSLVGRLGRQ